MGHRFSRAARWGTNGDIPEDNYVTYKVKNDMFDLKRLGDYAIHVEHNQTILCPSLHKLFYWGFPGQVRSCNYCATDFGIGVKYVPGAGQVLVLTVWRDLGGPSHEGEDGLRCIRKWQWDSHRCDV